MDPDRMASHDAAYDRRSRFPEHVAALGAVAAQADDREGTWLATDEGALAHALIALPQVPEADDDVAHGELTWHWSRSPGRFDLVWSVDGLREEPQARRADAGLRPSHPCLSDSQSRSRPGAAYARPETAHSRDGDRRARRTLPAGTPRSGDSTVIPSCGASDLRKCRWNSPHQRPGRKPSTPRSSVQDPGQPIPTALPSCVRHTRRRSAADTPAFASQSIEARSAQALTTLTRRTRDAKGHQGLYGQKSRRQVRPLVVTPGP